MATSKKPQGKVQPTNEPTPIAQIGTLGRMTDCCGACSTYDEFGVLYCKACFEPVPEGQGDGGGKIQVDLFANEKAADFKADATKVHIPEITLKRVEYSMRNARDSHCFGATVYLDGKAFCEASDDGNGGQTIYESITPNATGRRDTNFRALQEAVDKRIDEIDEALLIRDGRGEIHTRQDGSTFSMRNNRFDYIICDLVNDWLATKDLKRLLSRRVVFAVDGKIMQTNCAKNKAHLATWIQDYQVKPDGHTILNTLPFADALKLFRENTK